MFKNTQACSCWIGFLVAASITCSSCDPGYDITLTQGPPASLGPVGVTIPIHLSSTDTPGGVAVTLSALPSTISVSPTTTTIDNHGTATAYALVPYGTAGTIVASAAFATTVSVLIAAMPLTLCPPVFVPADNGADVTATGQVYTVSIKALQSGSCPSGAAAPSGVSIALTVSASLGSPTTATAITDASGTASANITVPWGAAVFVQATGGGATTFAAVSGTTNPATVSCLTWQNEQGVYKVEAKVTNGNTALSAMPVAFSIIYPSSSAGSVTPSSVLTDSHGVASTFVAVPNPASLPVVVEAVSGNSAFTTALNANPSSGGCQ